MTISSFLVTLKFDLGVILWGEIRCSSLSSLADDTSITFAGSDVDEVNNCINYDLERIGVWLAANKLKKINRRQEDRNPTDWF